MATATTFGQPRGASAAVARGWPALALRAAIVAVALAAMWPIASAGIGVHLSRGDPGRAADFAPGDARIAAAAAQAAIAGGANVRDGEVRRLVTSALARDVTLPSAIELRALDVGASGDEGRDARLFALSSRISRRSLATRLWLIQQAVDRGDVEGALQDFDIALRTSMAAPDVLFPVLAEAVTDPALAAPIARLLDRPDDWRIGFLYYAITQAHAGVGVSNVVLHMHDRRAIIVSQIDQALVGELVGEQQFALARTVRDALRPPPGRPGLVRDGDFSSPAYDFPFGWGLSDRGDAGAARGQADGRAGLSYHSAPGGAGAVASQLLLLAPGRYRLSAKTAAAAVSEAPAYWTLTCGQAGGAQIALLPQPPASGAVAAADLTVPPDCPAQWLALQVRPSDGPEGDGAVAWVAVAPSPSPSEPAHPGGGGRVGGG